MLRKIALALNLAGLLAAAELPAGTKLNIRLLTPLDSATDKPGQKIEAVVIAPVLAGSEAALSAGVSVRGEIKEVKNPQALDQRAEIDLRFDQLRDSSGKTAPISAKIVHIDNSRETIDENGRILGIVAKETGSARLDQGINKVAERYPGLAGILSVAKQAVVSEPDPAIKFVAGVEMTLELTKAVDWTGAASLPKIAPITPATRLAQLVNSEPFLTEAAKPPKPSDVTNLMLLGTQEALIAAFQEAGWTTAQRLNRESKFETFRALVENRGYHEAPVSTILLDGAAPDLVFEKTNDTFAARHHLRVWRRPGSFNGRPIWVGAATHDISIDFSQENATFIHRIDSEIDAERAKVVDDLIFTKRVSELSLVSRPDVPTSGMNATGDKFITDGRMAVLQF